MVRYRQNSSSNISRDASILTLRDKWLLVTDHRFDAKTDMFFKDQEEAASETARRLWHPE